MNTQQKFNEMQKQTTRRKYKANENAKAIELYKTGQYSYKQIAIMVQVQQKTVGKWIREHKKTAFDFKSEIKTLITRLNNEISKTELNPNAINSIANAIKTLKNLQD